VGSRLSARFTPIAPLLPLVIAAAALAAVALLLSMFFHTKEREGWAFTAGIFTVAFAVLTLWMSMFPNVMRSSTDVAFSLTIENASSTDYTLTIMSWAALIFLPLVLAYQGWTYWVFRRRITREQIPVESSH
jgi:cytochrome d ubiquinol oxidase subunit II